jgi:hypothetical protein
MKKYLIIAAIVLAVAVVGIIYVQHGRIERLTAERDRYKGNTEALMTDVEHFRVQDSLSAARAEALELTVKEFERFRASDAALIAELRQKNRDLASVNTTQAQTIIELSSVPRDTVIIRDSIPIKAVAVHCGDAWYDFDGLLTENEFTGRLANRDSLILAETVKYHRFLGFLWRTKRVDERQSTVVSRNPHTEILGVEHIVIEKK